MKKLNDTKQIPELKRHKRMVFMFTTTWCGDCTFIKPFLPAINERFDEYTFVEVDRDEFMDFAQELDVMGIPSFVVYHENKVVGRFVSKDRKTQTEIEAFLMQVEENIRHASISGQN